MSEELEWIIFCTFEAKLLPASSFSLEIQDTVTHLFLDIQEIVVPRLILAV